MDLINTLFAGLSSLTWGAALMMLVGGGLIYLAIVKEYEPVLLLPIGAGAILANLPLSPLVGEDGLLGILYGAGVANELFPLLIFVGIGAMTDFGPLLERPHMLLWARPVSSASLARFFWPCYWVSTSTKPRPSALSAPSMDQPPSM